MVIRILSVALLALDLAACAAEGPAASQRARGMLDFDESTLSQPTFEVLVEKDVRIPMRDGVELSTDVFRPDVPGPFPALLMRTPYGKENSARMSGGAYDETYLATRGYVVLLQDSRGRNDSQGTFEPFRDDADDGFDTVEWIAQQPWSNGRIAGLGQSYFGITQLLMAVPGSPHLTAIAPIMTTLDAYNNWIYNDGAFYLSFALGWGTGLGVRTEAAQRFAEAERSENPQAYLPLEGADVLQVGQVIPYYRDWMRHPARDQYWTERSPTDRLADLSVPALYYTGWYDFFLRGALNDYMAIKEGARDEIVRDGTRLIVGPWAHYTSTDGPPRVLGDKVDWGPSTLAVNLPAVELRWYDHWLKDMPTGVESEPPIAIFVMGVNEWRYENEWPLARTTYMNYYFDSEGSANTLNGDGSLSTALPVGDDTDTYAYDPSDPVPTMAAGDDHRSVEERDDVLIFTSETLAEALEVTGPITVRLFAASTARDTDFTAKLLDVHPDGYTQRLQQGIIRARYRESLDGAELLEPGEIYEYTIDLWDTSNVFLPGHRIRVEISSSNIPRYDRNLNTGDDQSASTRMQRATQTIYHDAERLSYIVLPVIPRVAHPSTSPRG